MNELEHKKHNNKRKNESEGEREGEGSRALLTPSALNPHDQINTNQSPPEVTEGAM